jgi:hypothetical protein
VENRPRAASAGKVSGRIVFEEVTFAYGKIKAPSTKHQAPEKLQASSSTRKTASSPQPSPPKEEREELPGKSCRRCPLSSVGGEGRGEEANTHNASNKNRDLRLIFRATAHLRNPPIKST